MEGRNNELLSQVADIILSLVSSWGQNHFEGA